MKEIDVKSVLAALSITPLESSRTAIDGWFVEKNEMTSLADRESMYPKVIITDPNVLGWKLATLPGVQNLNSRADSWNVIGTGSHVFAGIADYPALVAALRFSVASDEFNKQVRVRLQVDQKVVSAIEAGITYTVLTSYLEVNCKFDTREAQIIDILHPLWSEQRQLNESSGTVSGKGVYTQFPRSLKTAANPNLEVGDITEITASVSAPFANLKTSIQLVTPGSDRWPEYVEGSMLGYSDVAQLIDLNPQSFDRVLPSLNK